MEQGDKKIVGLEVGWSFVATGLSKIRRAIDGGGEGLSSEESSRRCTACALRRRLTTTPSSCTNATGRIWMTTSNPTSHRLRNVYKTRGSELQTICIPQLNKS